MTRIRAACLVAALAALPAAVHAQEPATVAPGAVLRGLDRVNGHTRTLELGNGQSTEFGGLLVRLDECRTPIENPEGDAYAFITIHEGGSNARVFSGWMLASSPALNPLEHHRFDVWVLRCST